MRGDAGGTTLPVVSRRTLIGSVLGALVVAGALAAALALTAGGSKSGSPASAASLSGVSAVQQMLAGVPQHGQALGSPTAPVTLVEFADPQCPYCAQWAVDALPAIVRDYVRTGKVRVVFNGMDFVGADSETALRTALAAGRQNRFWNVLELLYENQGTENTGWVTDGFLRSIGSAVPGLDVQKMLDARSSAAVGHALAQANALASEAGVNSTPSFAVGKTGGALQLVEVRELTAAALKPSLDAALRS
jgi:protein-disulfide isomerase